MYHLHSLKGNVLNLFENHNFKQLGNSPPMKIHPLFNINPNKDTQYVHSNFGCSFQSGIQKLQ